MSKSITIPTGMRQFEVSINGMKYVFTPGITVTVPDEVAEIIANNAANAPVTNDAPEDFFPKLIKFEAGEDEGQLKTDGQYLQTLVAWRKGKLVYAKLGEEIYLPVTLTNVRTMIFANRSIDPESAELHDKEIHWPFDGTPTITENVWSLTAAEDDSAGNFS